MHYMGHIEHGNVVLDEALNLPDGTRVTIAALASPTGPELHPDIKRLAGLLPENVDIDRLRLESILEKHSF